MEFGTVDLGNIKSMAIRKKMKGLPSDILSATGLLYHDWDAMTPCQRECNTRFVKSIQMEEEAYLSQHPEIKAMLEVFLSSIIKTAKRKDILKAACNFFLKPADQLDKDIRNRMKIPPNQDKYRDPNMEPYISKDWSLEYDLKNITVKHYPPPPWAIRTPCISTPNTTSSTFLSIMTSATTLPTPEPVIPPEPTISEIFYNQISNTVDKAIYSRVDDKSLRYDTAYVELSKCVEQAMEIPVVVIREDIAELLFNAYYLFSMNIMEKERIAAEIAWEKRMRKKLKRSLRRMNNFKGYETPPTPKSVVSSHESYKLPPQRPCVCHPQWHYNRYAKDRFGIYLPNEDKYCDLNTTATPAISVEDVAAANDDADETKSVASGKSGKSAVSKK